MQAQRITIVVRRLQTAVPRWASQVLQFRYAVALCMAFAVPSASAQLIVGHRGASADAPENTRAAFRLAFTQDADAVEGDFRLTADGHIVCLHDADLKRVAGTDRVVADSTLAELRQLDVGRWKDPRFAGERIPTLAEVIGTLPEGKRLVIEIKSGVEIVPVLRDELMRLQVPPEQATIISFSQDVIAAVRRQLPSYRVWWITAFKQDPQTGVWSPNVADVIRTARRLGAHGVDVKAVPEVVTQQFIAAVHAAGLECHCWTVNDPDWARQLRMWGMDSITTDAPGKLREVIPRESRTLAPAG